MIISQQTGSMFKYGGIMTFIPVDRDVQELSLRELRQWYMQRRQEARNSITTLKSEGNNNCWIDMFKTVQNLLPAEEEKKFELGKFNMCSNEILYNCRKWVEFQQSQGNVLPDREPRLL